MDKQSGTSVMWYSAEQNAFYHYSEEKDAPAWFAAMKESIADEMDVVEAAEPPFPLPVGPSGSTEISREKKVIFLQNLRDYGIPFIMSIGGSSLISVCGFEEGKANPITNAVMSVSLQRGSEQTTDALHNEREK